MSNQPALYSQIMSIISIALEKERDLEDTKREQQKQMIESTNGQGNGKVSLLHGPAKGSKSLLPGQ